MNNKPDKKSTTQTTSTMDNDLLQKNHIIGIVIIVIGLIIAYYLGLFTILSSLAQITFPLNLIVYGWIAIVAFAAFALSNSKHIKVEHKWLKISALIGLSIISLSVISLYAIADAISRSFNGEG